MKRGTSPRKRLLTAKYYFCTAVIFVTETGDYKQASALLSCAFSIFSRHVLARGKDPALGGKFS
jgi:hypothetical protein